MKRLSLLAAVFLGCSLSHAQNENKLSGFELGALYEKKYSNPQCRGLRGFTQNTANHYRRAYNGEISLKKADELVGYQATRTINRIKEQNIPLPFSYRYLMEEAAAIQTKIFNNQIKDSDQYLDAVYNKCVTILANSVYSNNDNYDRTVNYSKGEDKIPREKITKVEQVCDKPDFPALMEKARINIREFAGFRNLSTEKFLKRSNYSSLNRMAEDMLQAGLDHGTINQQFLWDIYNAPKRGLDTGHLPSRCAINR